MNEEKLMKMKLHEFHEEKFYEVFRVLGGWVYTFREYCNVNGGPNQWVKTSVFVPETNQKKD